MRAAGRLTSLPRSLGSFMSTAERLRLPDDCTVGYIVEGLLGARLLHSPLFHSHLESLQRLPPEAVLQQVGPLPWACSPSSRHPGWPARCQVPSWLGRSAGAGSALHFCVAKGGPWPGVFCLLAQGRQAWGASLYRAASHLPQGRG